MKTVTTTQLHLAALAIMISVWTSRPGLAQQVELQPGTVIEFAAGAEAREHLRTSDPYTRAMTPLDRSLRMRTNQPRTEEQYLVFAEQQARMWTQAEIGKMTGIIEEFRDKLASYSLPLGERILLVKTSGNEEFRSAYVRDGVIIFPQNFLSLEADFLQHILLHEIFHVLSYRNPHLRPALYSAIGYFKVNEVAFPEAFSARLFTNPDAYEKNFATRVTREGVELVVIPITYSRLPGYDGNDDLFHYLSVMFVELEEVDGTYTPIILPDGWPKEAPNEMVTEHYYRIGDSSYIPQPEELLAELFPTVILEPQAMNSPRVVHLLREVLLNPSRIHAGLHAGIYDGAIEVGVPESEYWIKRSHNLRDWEIYDKGAVRDGVIHFSDREAWLEPVQFYKAAPRISLLLDPGATNEMIWIAPGTFTMGSPVTEQTSSNWERPLTEVTISKGFWMGKYEVTRGEFLTVTGGDLTSEIDLDLPVVATWLEAVEYCQLLTEQAAASGALPDGLVYRLPTEAEWEYACRAGTTTPYNWGENPAGAYTHAWLRDNARGQLKPVGLKKPNAWGLHDMHGNIAEWCHDLWQDRLPGGSVTDYQGPSTGMYRVFRGGNAGSPSYLSRSGYRFFDSPDSTTRFEPGFRIVLGNPLD